MGDGLAPNGLASGWLRGVRATQNWREGRGREYFDGTIHHHPSQLTDPNHKLIASLFPLLESIPLLIWVLNATMPISPDSIWTLTEPGKGKREHSRRFISQEQGTGKEKSLSHSNGAASTPSTSCFFEPSSSLRCNKDCLFLRTMRTNTGMSVARI